MSIPRRLLSGAIGGLGLLMVLSFAGSAAVAVRADEGAPDVSSLQLPQGPVKAAVDPRLRSTQGEVQVIVQSTDTPLALARGISAKQVGAMMTRPQQRDYLAVTRTRQSALMGAIRGLGGRELARVNKALVAVAISIDASRIDELAALPGVKSVRPVINYYLDLTETVPHIGASAVQAAGFDGTGIRVAVLDSGIDYTHSKLGGSGLPADYVTCYASNTTINDSNCPFFPNAKVVGGYDFVGETWPNGPLAPDPDPIALAGTGFHGTHVADIIAGLESTQGAGDKGVAPGASLYAVKVCSALSSACSGVALLEGMDFALDPNGDGDISDAVDIVNMSLGSNYGMKEDDLSEASRNAVKAGVVVVAAAGNAGDRPYIVSSPSSTPEVISAAQTTVPSDELFLVVTGVTAPVGAVAQPWAAVPSLTNGALTYDTANKLGCTPFLASHTGQTLLMDRGTCAVSIKVSNAAAAGAVAAIVANNVSQAPGDLPPTFSFGGGTPNIPGYTITRADGSALKAAALGVAAQIDPSAAVSIVNNIIPTSARGPSVSFNAIKPDIGAPGASVSAEAGTGTGKTAFGGTSGATPMISGSAALLLQKYPTREPYAIKSVLMNTAERNITINPVSLPGVLTPITRIGGGEVRVDKAFGSTTAAWESVGKTGSLSFGYSATTGPQSFKKQVVVRNYAKSKRTYTITPSFRYANDAASGAVTLSMPGSISLNPNSSKNFQVTLTVDPSKLPVWGLNGGSRGGDGFRLQDVEFDGYIDIADSADDVHVAWQVLPHRAAKVQLGNTDEDDIHVHLHSGVGAVTLNNTGGAVDGRVEVFSLTGESHQIPKSQLPKPGDNFAVIDLKSVGVRQVDIGGGQFGIQFAVNTFGERAHPNYPAEFDILIDTNRDGVDDFVIFNFENGGFGASGQNVVAAGPLPSGPFTAFFFTDADLDSGNAILTAPMAAVGLTPGTQFDFSVLAFDNYFTGNLTDAIFSMTYTSGAPRFVGFGVPPTGVPAGGSSILNVQAVPNGDVASPSQAGLLLMYRDGRPKREAAAVKIP